jgi:hypothetical protein
MFFLLPREEGTLKIRSLPSQEGTLKTWLLPSREGTIKTRLLPSFVGVVFYSNDCITVVLVYNIPAMFPQLFGHSTSGYP